MIKHIPIFILYLIFLILIGISFRDFGMSWDEPDRMYTAPLYIENFWNPTLLKKSLDAIDERLFLSYSAVIIAIEHFPLLVIGKQYDISAIHLVRALFASVTLLFVYLISQKLWNKTSISLVSVVFFIMQPRWFGDIFDNFTDGTATLLFSMVVYLGLRVFEARSNHQLIRLVLFALISAVAFTHRLFLVYIPISMYMLSMISTIFDARQSRQILLKQILSLLFFGAFFIVCLYVVDPPARFYGTEFLAMVLRNQSAFFSTDPSNSATSTTLFNGAVLSTAHLPWFYIPVWIAITTPLVTLIFSLMGLGIVSYHIVKFRLRTSVLTESAIVLLTLFPIIGLVIVRPILLDGWRYVQFLTVPIAILAAYGWYTIWKISKSTRVIFAVVLVCSFLFTGMSMKSLHPYEYIYFNSLVGGIKGAYGRYEIDYWGKSQAAGIQWLEAYLENKSVSQVGVATCGNPIQGPYYFSNHMKSVSLDTADYFICFTRSKFIPYINTYTPIYTVTRDGVPLTVVERIH